MRLYLILCRVKKGTFIKTNYNYKIRNKIQNIISNPQHTQQNPQQNPHTKPKPKHLTPKNHSLP